MTQIASRAFDTNQTMFIIAFLALLEALFGFNSSIYTLLILFLLTKTPFIRLNSYCLFRLFTFPTAKPLTTGLKFGSLYPTALLIIMRLTMSLREVVVLWIIFNCITVAVFGTSPELCLVFKVDVPFSLEVVRYWTFSRYWHRWFVDEIILKSRRFATIIWSQPTEAVIRVDEAILASLRPFTMRTSFRATARILTSMAVMAPTDVYLVRMIRAFGLTASTISAALDTISCFYLPRMGSVPRITLIAPAWVTESIIPDMAIMVPSDILKVRLTRAFGFSATSIVATIARLLINMSRALYRPSNIRLLQWTPGQCVGESPKVSSHAEPATPTLWENEEKFHLAGLFKLSPPTLWESGESFHLRKLFQRHRRPRTTIPREIPPEQIPLPPSPILAAQAPTVPPAGQALILPPLPPRVTLPSAVCPPPPAWTPAPPSAAAGSGPVQGPVTSTRPAHIPGPRSRKKRTISQISTGTPPSSPASSSYTPGPRSDKKRTRTQSGWREEAALSRCANRQCFQIPSPMRRDKVNPHIWVKQAGICRDYRPRGRGSDSGYESGEEFYYNNIEMEEAPGIDADGDLEMAGAEDFVDEGWMEGDAMDVDPPSYSL